MVMVRYKAPVGNAILAEASPPQHRPPRAYLMELRCPNCGSTDLKKVSLVYEEGLSRVTAKSRLRGVSLGDGGPNVIVGRATTRGTSQTRLSKKLEPPKKWSYAKLLLWAGIIALVLLIAHIRWVMSSPSPVSSIPIVMAGVIGLLAFVAALFMVWRHNQLAHPRLSAEWEASFVCRLCGQICRP